jgi:hypothetical protein
MPQALAPFLGCPQGYSLGDFERVGSPRIGGWGAVRHLYHSLEYLVLAVIHLPLSELCQLPEVSKKSPKDLCLKLSLYHQILPQPNEQPHQKDDAFAFRLEMLKKELGFIDSSIRKIDDIGNSIKNWAILSWTEAIAIILGRPELYGYVAFSAIPPLLFMMLDAHWRKI